MRAYKLISIFFALVAISAQATLVKLSDLHTMAKRSDIVVHGFVGEQRVETDDLGRLITLTDVEIIDGLRGVKSGDVITIYQVGGQKNGVVMPLLGGQNYNVGQEIFFFGLKLDTTFVSYGAGQGKLDIIHQGDHDVVREDLGNVATINTTAMGKTVSRPEPLMFEDSALFKDELKLMIQAH